MKNVARRFFLFASALILFVGAPSVWAKSNKGDFHALQNNSISESDYWKLVEDSREAVAEIENESSEIVRQKLKELSSKWESVKAVRLSDGQIVALDNGYLLAAMNAEGADPKEIVKIFDALLSAHREYPSRVFEPGALASLNEILSRPEFQWPDGGKNPIGEYLQELLNKFFDWLNKLLGNRQPVNGSSGATIPIIPMIATILLVLVVGFAFRTLFSDFINDAQFNEENAAEEILTSHTAFEKAQTLSREGNYRSAVRYLYLSSLLLLDERGLLRYDRSKTNHEYLRSVSTSPEIAKPLGEVIETFDNVWYGYHALDENAFQEYSARVEELKEKKA